jgi:hypothetical protein
MVREIRERMQGCGFKHLSWSTNMKRTGIFVALIGTALSLTLQKSCTEASAPGNNLATATMIINGRCPEMVDRETQLDSVVLSHENHLVYYYTLLYREKGSVNVNALTGFLMPAINTNVRENQALSMHRDSSIVMDFLYRDKNGEFLTSMTLGPEDYR